MVCMLSELSIIVQHYTMVNLLDATVCSSFACGHKQRTDYICVCSSRVPPGGSEKYHDNEKTASGFDEL